MYHREVQDKRYHQAGKRLPVYRICSSNLTGSCASTYPPPVQWEYCPGLGNVQIPSRFVWPWTIH